MTKLRSENSFVLDAEGTLSRRTAYGTNRRLEGGQSMSAIGGQADFRVPSSDFRVWHFSDMAGLRNVRYLGASGLPGCEFGLPSLDPKRTFQTESAREF